jgi:ribonuclease VapC
MFIDASAIVAILTREPEADALADVLESARSPITSPIAIFEAALGICRKRHASVEEAGEDVREFLGVAGVRTVSITEREAETALAAFSRYGRGRGHPAHSTSAIASRTRWRKTIGRRCCSKARISTRPTSLSQLGRNRLSHSATKPGRDAH